MSEWTNDERVMTSFDVLMESTYKPLMNYLELMTPHFDNSPNTTLLRLLGFAVYHYQTFDGEAKESFDNMMGEMLKNPLLQNLLMIQSSNVINEAAGV
tara:strand:+ start:1121 stop:1414 length:294 start_codon:yes stop_codon:yes gene_type:complete